MIYHTNILVFRAAERLGESEHDTVRLLDSSAEFTFHLTGSHFFGCARPDSDIDFIVRDSDEVIAYLESLGFSRMGGDEQEYDVPETQTRGVYQNGRVQVQVSRAFGETLIARDILTKYFAEPHRKASGETRREVWTQLIGAIASVRDEFVLGAGGMPLF